MGRGSAQEGQEDGNEDTAASATELCGDICAEALSRMAAVRDAVERSKALQFMVYLCNCPLPEFVERSLQTMESLTAPDKRSTVASDAVSAQLATHGALRPLVALLGRSTDNGILGRVAALLANLAAVQAVVPKVVAEGAVRPLVQLIPKCNGNSLILARAAAALRNIGSDMEARPTLVQGGALEPLISLVSTSQHAEVIANAAAALANAALHERTAAQLVADGGSRPLINLLVRKDMNMGGVGDDVLVGGERSVHAAAARALANMAQHPALRAGLSGEGAIRPLVNVLINAADGSSNTDADTNTSGKADVINNAAEAARAVANLANEDALRQELMAAGVVAPLVKLCVSQGENGSAPVLLIAAIEALRNIARHEPSRPQLLKDGVLDAALQLCALWTDSAPTRGSVGDGGTADATNAASAQEAAPAADVPCRKASVEILRFATGAVANLALHPQVRQQLCVRSTVDHGGLGDLLKPLVRLLIVSADETVLGNAAGAAATLAAAPQLRDALIATGAAAPLVTVCAASADHALDARPLRYAASALAALCTARPAIGTAGFQLDQAGSSVLPRLGDSPRGAVAADMAELRDGSGGAMIESHRVAVADAGALPALTRLLATHTDARVLAASASALAGLFGSADVRRRPAASAVTAPLTHLLAGAADERLLTAAATALGALAAGERDADAAARATMLAAAPSPLPALVALCGRARGAETLAAAARTLAQFARDSAGRLKLLYSRVLPPLLAMCARGRTGSAAAGAALAAAASQEAGDEQVTAQKVAAAATPTVDIDSAVARMVTEAARAVATLADEPSARQQLLDEGAAPPLINIVADSRIEAALPAASLALARIADHSTAGGALPQEGCVRPLVSLLGSRMDSGGSVSNADASEGLGTGYAQMIVENCTAALAALAQLPKNRTRMLNEGAIPPLVSVIASAPSARPLSFAALHAAARALASLALDETLRPKLIAASAPRPLVTLLNAGVGSGTGPPAPTPRAAAAAASSATPRRSAEAIVAAAAAAAAERVAAAQAREAAASALANLAVHAPCRGALVGEACVPPLVSLCGATPTDAATLAEAEVSGTNGAGAPLASGHMAADTATPGAVRAAIEALRTLALSDENRAHLVEHRALRPLIRICSTVSGTAGTDDTATLRLAVQALSLLVAHDAHAAGDAHLNVAKRAIDEGAAAPLAHLLAGSADNITLRYAAEAVANIAADGDRHAQCRAKLLALSASAYKPASGTNTVVDADKSSSGAAGGVLAPLLRLASASENDGVRAAAAAAIRFLAAPEYTHGAPPARPTAALLCGHTDAAALLLRAGVLLPLLRILGLGSGTAASNLTSDSALDEQVTGDILLEGGSARSRLALALAHAAAAIANLATTPEQVHASAEQAATAPATLSATAEAAMAVTHAHRERMVSSGAAPPLVALLSGGAEVGGVALAAAAAAIANLAAAPAARSRIVKDGAVVPLVQLIMSDGMASIGVEAAAPAARDDGASVDGGDSAGAGAVARAGAGGIADGKSSTPVVLHAVRALARLARHAPSRSRLVTDGAVWPLVQLCSKSYDDDVLAHAAAALSALASASASDGGHDSDFATRLQVVEEGAVAPLVELCISSSNDAVLCAAVEAIANLALLGSAADVAGAARSATVEVADAGRSDNNAAQSLTADEDDDEGSSAASPPVPPGREAAAMANATAQAAGATAARKHLQLANAALERLVAEGAIGPLVTLATSSQNVRVLRAAARALRNLAAAGHIASTAETLAGALVGEATVDLRPRLLEEGAPRPLVALCSRSEDARTLRYASSALALLAGLGNPSRSALVAEGAVRPLVALCARMGRMDGLISASNVAAAQDGAVFDTEESVDAHAAQMSSVAGEAALPLSEDTIVGNASEALANLARFDEARPRIVLEGALEPLVAVCKRGMEGCATIAAATATATEVARTRVIRYAAGAIANIACHASSRGAIVNAGAARPLVALCTLYDSASGKTAPSGWAQVLGNGAGALANMALLPAARDALLSSGAVAPLVALLQHSSDERVLGCAAGAIANLANGESRDDAADSSGDGAERARTAIFDASAVRPLVQLLSRSKDHVVLGNTAEALANLIGASVNGGVNVDMEQVAAADQDMDGGELSADENNQRTDLTQKHSERVIAAVVAEGAAAPMVQVTSHLTDGRVLATTCRLAVALARSRVAANRAALLDAGIVWPLVQLLGAALDEPVLSFAAATLSALVDPSDGAVIPADAAVTSSSTAPTAAAAERAEQRAKAALDAFGSAINARAQLVQEGALRPLITLCSRTKESIGVTATVATQEGNGRISAMGGAGAALLLHREATLRHATATLAAIALDDRPACRNELAAAESCPAALAAVCTASTDGLTLRSATAAIAALTELPDARPPIAAGGTAPPLVALLSAAADGTVLRCAARALGSLALDDEARGTVLAAGALEPLVRLRSRCDTDAVMEPATSALRNVARDPTARSAAVEAGAARLAVEICSSASTRSKLTLANAAGTIANLALDGNCRGAIMEAGAVPPLVALCARSRDTSVLGNAAQAIVNLARLDEARPMIVREGGVAPLVELCRSAQDRRVLGNAAGALATLALHAESREAIVAAGAAAPLLSLCGRSADNRVLRFASGAVANLALHEPSRENIVAAGAVRPLVQLCAASRDVLAVGNAVGALATLARARANAQALARGGAAAAVVRLCGSSAGGGRASDTALLGYGTELLLHLAADGGSREQVAREGAVACLVELCASSADGLVLQHSAGALSYLALSELGRSELVAEGGVPPLVMLVTHSADPSILAYAAAALRNVAIESRHRLPLVHQGALPPVVRLITTQEDEEVLSAAAGAVANVAADEECLHAVVQEGAVRPLVRLLGGSAAGSVSDEVPEGEVYIAGERVANVGFADAVLAEAARALTRVAYHESAAISALQDGATRALIALLGPKVDNGGNVGDAAGDSSVHVDSCGLGGSLRPAVVLEHAAAALSALSRAGAAARTQLVLEGAVRPLLSLCRGDVVLSDAAVLLRAVDTLAQLAAEAEVRPQLVLEGALPPLLALASNRALAGEVGTGLRVVAWATQALASLALYEPAALQLAGTGNADARGDTGLQAASESSASVEALIILLQLPPTIEESSAASGVGLGAPSADAGSIDPTSAAPGQVRPIVVGNAAATLRNLARHEPNRLAIVRAGAVAPLISTLGHCSDARTLALAAGTLANLGFLDAARPVIVEAGAVAPLVALCNVSADTTVLGNAAAALRNLARDESSRARIVQEGAVPPLVHLCSSSTDNRVLGYSAGALVNLALHESTRPQLVAEGAVGPLVGLCANSRDNTVLGYACQALVNLACHTDCRSQLVTQGALAPLIALVGANEDATVLANAAACLAELGRDEANRAPIAADGAARPLAALLERSTDPRVLGNAAGALANLAALPANRAALVEQGVVRPLVELCTRSNEARVIGNAAEALANIAPLEADSGTEIVKGGVVWCGGIGAFVELLARSKDLRVLGFAALALARVCVDERSRPQALQEGCLRPLIALLRTVPLPHDAAAEAAKMQAQATAMATDGEQGNDNAEAQAAAAAAAAAIRTDSVTASAALNVLTNACHALENLALFDAARALLVSEGAITPVVKLLAKSPTPALLARAAGVLRNVARHDGSRATIASEGAVPPLVMLLSGSADDAVLRNAAAALANLALAEALRGKLVGDGAVWPLVQLVSSASDSQVLGNAAAALRNLARDEASRPRIVQEGAVGPLVQVCASNADARVTSFAAEALVTLALHEQSGPQIVEEGAVVPLAQLCSTSTDNAMLSYASGALANLALDEGSRAQMVADGAVAPLVKICSKSQDKRVLGYAALALARLAMSEGSSLADVSGGSALYGLTRAQQTLGRDMPPYLIQPLADAIVALTPRPSFS